MDALEMKAVFQAGWQAEARVTNYLRILRDGEFGDADCRAAWREALREALGGAVPESTPEAKIAVDIGTGPGTMAHFWAELGLEVTGIDFSATMLTAAREETQRRGLRIAFRQGDAEDPPVAPESVDLVSSRLVLFNLPRPGLAIRRWKRLLRRNGRMVLVGIECDLERMIAYREQLERDAAPKDTCTAPAAGWRPDAVYSQALRALPMQLHTAGAIAALLEAAGLRRVREISTDAMVTTRERFRRSSPDVYVEEARPYILVGEL